MGSSSCEDTESGVCGVNGGSSPSLPASVLPEGRLTGYLLFSV